MSQAWYAEGLKFSCQGCGGCCRGPGGYVWLTDEEAEKIATRLGFTLKQFSRRYIRLVYRRVALIDSPTGDCIFLSPGGQCQVYEDRPIQCRTWPWWPENLTSPEVWEELMAECPGINRGELHPVTEIETKANEKGS